MRRPSIDEAWLAETVREWPGAEAAVKPAWDTFVLTVAGKLFGLYGDASGEPLLTLKGDPLENAALRQTYPEIIPGYHMNKQHWISVRLDPERCTLSLEHIAELLAVSYTLVFTALPRLQQAILKA